MSRVPLIVPLWVLGILLVTSAAVVEPQMLVVEVGAILIAGGLLLRFLLRHHDREHNTD